MNEFSSAHATIVSAQTVRHQGKGVDPWMLKYVYIPTAKANFYSSVMCLKNTQVKWNEKYLFNTDNNKTEYKNSGRQKMLLM